MARRDTAPHDAWRAGETTARPARIGIVGSGPSAVYTLQALMRARSALDVTLFEAGAQAGVGVPYNPANTDPSMLANIASVEIPPLGETLEDWLRGRSDDELARLKVERAAIGPRAFLPRVVLGAYFGARLADLIAQAPTRGHAVRALTRHKVVDVMSQGAHARILAQDARGAIVDHAFDRVIVATGHKAPKSAGGAAAPRLREAYAATSAGDLSGEIGVLGASLSAIDVTVATAARHGAFERGADGELVYRPRPDAPAFRLTLMSRGGLLPEADFYCPIPYLPLDVITPQAMDALIAQGRGGLLDRAFALFAEELALADPDYARAIGLADLAPQDFATAYFAARAAADPFDWARRNLAECRANAAARHTVPWRYAILRAHEVFARAVPHFDAADRRRFDVGLKAVFMDNYAAIPPESIERILALHSCGRIDLRRLGRAYKIVPHEDGARSLVQIGRDTLTFDHLVDARGQSALGVDEIAFPSLRLKLKANRLAETQPAEEAPADRAVAIDESFRLAPGLNPVSNIYFLSLPFLLDRNPFVQGLCSAHDMGEIVAARILAELDEPGAMPDVVCEVEALRQLRDGLRVDRQPIYCLDSGLVVIG